MTAILDRPTTETTETSTPAEPAAPETLTFTVGDVVIEAATEDEALRKYKRMVRAQALKAQVDMNWCDAGTNERLERLGCRLKGQGVGLRVRVVAERTAYINLDAEDEAEALEMLGDGEDPEILTMVTALVGRGWKAQVVEPAPRRDKPYAIGDADDTMSSRIGSSDGARQCETYSSRYGYCTLPHGHGGDQHVVGDGRAITGVWAVRRPTPPAEGEPLPVLNEVFEDYVRDGRPGRCGATQRSSGYVCTRRDGHTGDHVGAFPDRIVGRIWSED